MASRISSSDSRRICGVTLPFSSDISTSTWEGTLGAICGVVLVVAAVVYVFGRRSGRKLSDDQRLAHLATLDPAGLNGTNAAHAEKTKG